MKKLFYGGVALLVLFELANVWFIMPLPGSQRMNSVDAAYALYRFRWLFRVAFGAMVVAGLLPALRVASWRKVFPAVTLGVGAAVVYMTNFVMAADQMFLMPQAVRMQPLAGNRVEPRRLIVGVALNGEARAYPLQFIGYHHQLQDSVGGKPVLETYCTVCRTGRVYDPVIDGRASFFAFARDKSGALKPIQASQEFWHSWRTFQPGTTRY